MQQQQQQQQPGRQLLRPTAVQPAHLRELLQQQITSATCCADLHELLVGRQQVLTLKHLAYMVQQVRALTKDLAMFRCRHGQSMNGCDPVCWALFVQDEQSARHFSA
jgi:hypothetical protein